MTCKRRVLNDKLRSNATVFTSMVILRTKLRNKVAVFVFKLCFRNTVTVFICE